MAWTTPTLVEICVGLEINANHVRSASEGYVSGIARPIHLGIIDGITTLNYAEGPWVKGKEQKIASPRVLICGFNPVATDTVGNFPAEKGLALWCEEETAASLARAFDQYAYYEVSSAIRVKDARTRAIQPPA